MKKVSASLLNENIILSTWQKQTSLTTNEAKKLIADIKKLLPKQNKYRQEKVIRHGIKFDSTMEADFYDHLCDKYGKEKVIIQPKFELQSSFKQDGKLVRAITYTADFMLNLDGHPIFNSIVYDVKGMLTQQGKMRIKMFQQKYPELSLQLITKCPKKYQLTYGKWIGLDDLAKERKLNKKDK